MDNYTIIWLILGILLLLSEFLIPGFLVFFFGIGALITSLLTFLIAPLNNYLAIQVIIFALSSVILLYFLRKRFKKSLMGEEYKENHEYIGDECKVVESVDVDKPGRILYQGTTWTAYSWNKKVKKNRKATLVGKKEGEPMVFIIEEKENKE